MKEDIYNEYIKLLEINKNLRLENERLQNLLRLHNINYENDKTSLSKKQKIEIYLSYFKGRKEVIASKYYKDRKKAYSICFVIIDLKTIFVITSVVNVKIKHI